MKTVRNSAKSLPATETLTNRCNSPKGTDRKRQIQVIDPAVIAQRFDELIDHLEETYLVLDEYGSMANQSTISVVKQMLRRLKEHAKEALGETPSYLMQHCRITLTYSWNHENKPGQVQLRHKAGDGPPNFNEQNRQFNKMRGQLRHVQQVFRF